MFQLQVFPAERELGLESLIQASSSFVTSANIEPVKLDSLPQERIESIERQCNHAVASGGRNFSADLYYLRSVLASIGWNNNDDIFSVADTWAVRHSADHKMLNLGHDHNRIVGHMLESYVVDEDANLIADDTPVEDLPPKFDIVNGEVLYTWFADKQLMEDVTRLIAEIEAQQAGEIEPKWFVSMECLIHHFDYGLHDLATGESLVVARNAETAFLTKHLRRYKGDGYFENYRIGRVLKDFFFSGKGFTENPANSRSDILAEHDAFFQASANVLQNASDFITKTSKSVYLVSAQLDGKDADVSDVSSEVTLDMTITIEQLQAEKAQLLSELESTKASLREADSKKFAERIQELESALESALAKNTEIATASDTAAAELKEALSKVEELEAVKASLQKESERATAAEESLANLNSEILTEKRIAAAAEKLGVDKEEATKVVRTLASASDEQFEESLLVLATLRPAVAPKATSAAAPPQATSLPSPTVVTASQDLSADDQELLSALDGLESSTASVVNSGDDDGASVLASDVLKYFGVEDDA